MKSERRAELQAKLEGEFNKLLSRHKNRTITPLLRKQIEAECRALLASYVPLGLVEKHNLPKLTVLQNVKEPSMLRVVDDDHLGAMVENGEIEQWVVPLE